MKNGPLLLLGLFVAITLSWGGLVLGSHRQLGALAPYYDDAESNSFPSRTSGIAARGQVVYAELGCAACHTQQVRRPDFGSDQERGWGERQSVARDYIFQARPQLGASRIGPDLTNLASRKLPYDAEDLTKLLYLGSSMHPPYKFLFEDREIAGQPSSHAVRLTGNHAAMAGHEIVPTERAQSLIAYLLSLNNAYDYPESRPVAPAAEKGHGAAKHDEKAAPAKADEKAAPAKAGETTAPAKAGEKAAPAKADEKLAPAKSGAQAPPAKHDEKAPAPKQEEGKK